VDIGLGTFGPVKLVNSSYHLAVEGRSYRPKSGPASQPELAKGGEKS